MVGPSGSGKSTIANLIPRLYDVCKGKITFDGVDIRDIDLKWLRNQIGIVSQETYLFNGTIRENLLYAKPDATDEELLEVCQKANIVDFIMNQEKGLDTIVGNRGLKLSGGEKQRLSIARVLLKDPALLIFDEATSALDNISERHIQQAMEELMTNHTVIIVAHRLSTIKNVDRILVFDKGKIVEEGSYQELADKENGMFAKLLNN